MFDSDFSDSDSDFSDSDFSDSDSDFSDSDFSDSLYKTFSY